MPLGISFLDWSVQEKDKKKDKKGKVRYKRKKEVSEGKRNILFVTPTDASSREVERKRKKDGGIPTAVQTQ